MALIFARQPSHPHNAASHSCWVAGDSSAKAGGCEREGCCPGGPLTSAEKLVPCFLESCPQVPPVLHSQVATSQARGARLTLLARPAAASCRDWAAQLVSLAHGVARLRTRWCDSWRRPPRSGAALQQGPLPQRHCALHWRLMLQVMLTRGSDLGSTAKSPSQRSVTQLLGGW